MDCAREDWFSGDSVNFDEFSFKAFKLHGFLSKVALGYGKLCLETKGFCRTDMRFKRSRLHRWVLAGCLLGGAWLFPWQVVADPVEQTYKKLRIFAHVLSFIQNNYVTEVDENVLVHDAIKGMLRSLDAHTVYMTPAEYQKTQEDTSGAYGGLGIVIFNEGDKGYVIRKVNADSPAAHAGLLMGDQLLAVDNEPVEKLSLSQLANKIRGLPGTKLLLKVMRDGWSGPRDIPLIRKRVVMKSVTYKLLNRKVGYLAIRSFQENTEVETQEAIKAMAEKNGEALKGLVLDLRNNPGGLFDEGVSVADRFLAKGKIVTTESRHARHREVQMASADDTNTEIQLAVLVNRHTASSSEIVAGALKAHDRAFLLGEPTYGKGSVQTLIGLEDGSGLKITVASYNTPDGQPIPAEGIVPHAILEPPERDNMALDQDPWVQAALTHLKSQGL